jgi:uncharacterized protein (TIRG00374 family)
MRKFIIALVLLVGVVFILWRLAEVEAIVETLEAGEIRFIALGLIIVFFWLLNAATLYYSVYRVLGLEDRISNLFYIAAAANFLNIIAPSAGMSGMAIFISESKRRNLPSGRVMVAGALTVLFEYTGFICILFLGIVVLLRRNSLNIAQISASVLLLVVLTGFCFLIYLGLRSGEDLGRALAGVSRLINRTLYPIVHREYLSLERARMFAQEMSNGLSELRASPTKLFIPALLGLSKHSILIIVLYLTFRAFNVPVTIGTLIAGFSVAYLFVIISPTPAGLGVVEGFLTLSLTSMYIPLGTATVITLAYRGLTFWVPFLFGMYALRHLSGMHGMQPVT